MRKSGKGPFVVALEGDLGAGKTTFIKGLARGLGLTRRITSPTFLMVRRYELPADSGEFKNLYHIDAYRMHSARDLKVTGGAEALRGKKNIVAVEWADRIKRYLPPDAVSVKITHREENERALSFARKKK